MAAPTEEQMQTVFEEVKNWNRWGPDDESGALNLITAETRLSAISAVHHGETVSCARELPVEPTVENPQPAMHMMLRAGDDCYPGEGEIEISLDFVGVAYHGTGNSHIDALCHVFVDGVMYNGFSADQVKSTGARRNSIMSARDGILGRGVLLDIPRLRGVEWLDTTSTVELGELQAASEAQGVILGPGDILLISTGRDKRRAAMGPWSPLDGLAGLSWECLRWLREKDISVLGSDGVSDPLPPNGPGKWLMPFHQCALVAMGVHLLDNLRLDRLAAACDRLEQWTFLFCIAPLRIEGGTGSPVNAIAVL